MAGTRTPQPINKAKYQPGDLPAMEDVQPECYQQLVGIRDTLERHYKDMQDIEFTIEKGKLTCCRPATASGPPRLRSRSPSTWLPKG